MDALLAVAGVNLQRALAGDHQIVHAAHLDEARLLHHRLVLDRQAHNRRCCVAGEHRAVRSDDHLHVVHVGHGLPVARQVAVEERCARLRLHLAQHGDAVGGPGAALRVANSGNSGPGWKTRTLYFFPLIT